jgi:Ca-activated chloride channel family protein
MVRLGFAIAVAALSSAAVAHAGELPKSVGLYPQAGPALPMLDSKIEVTVRGPVVEAVVTQRFQNRTDKATEATYVFPLPIDSAVSAMSIKSGNRSIHASIEKREDAQRRYEGAVRAGVAAALLDQERPDVFTQTVAAIPARGTVEITLRFDTMARYQDGTWELVVPLVVAPRYVPGVVTNRPTTGTGRAPDTDRAPDASRVTPGGAPGAGGSTAVTLKFFDKPTDVTSPTHEIKVSGSDATFVDPKSDHDAIVRWKTPATAAGWVEQDADGGYAAVVVEAGPATPRKGTMRCLLVLDRSATSRGDADAIAHPLVKSLLASLTASDRVAVAGSDQIAWTQPADAARALEQVWSSPAGAFDLTKVLAAARPDGAAVVLVSGGLVADDRAAVAAAIKLGVPVHVIGVGPAPARGLLAQIAAATGGTVRFAVPGDDVVALAKSALADAASQPIPLTVTWGTLAASDVVPGSLARVGAGQATIVLARVKRAQTANGRARGELFAIETLPAPRIVDGATTAMGPLARRWARNRLDELLSTKATTAVVTAHALHYGLVSPHTSMVAIGDEVVVQGGVKRSIAVPVSVPSGMKWQAVKKETTVDVDVAEAPAIDKTSGGDDAKKTVKPVKPSTDPRRNVPGGGRTPTTTDDKPPAAKKPLEPTKPTKKEKDKEAKERQDKEARERDYRNKQRAPVVVNKAPVPVVVRPEPTSVGGTTVTPTAPPPPPTMQPEPVLRHRRTHSESDGDEDDANTKSKKAADSPREAYGGTIDSTEGEMVTISSSAPRRGRWRVAAGVGGGLLRAGGETTSVLSIGTRVEIGLGGRAMAGLDGALWLVDGKDVEGHLLASFARRGLARWLELGLGAGLHFGNGVGPAASLSLRYHLPPLPRAAGFLRYDGALHTDDLGTHGESSFTLGLEYGF